MVAGFRILTPNDFYCHISTLVINLSTSGDPQFLTQRRLFDCRSISGGSAATSKENLPFGRSLKHWKTVQKRIRFSVMKYFASSTKLSRWPPWPDLWMQNFCFEETKNLDMLTMLVVVQPSIPADAYVAAEQPRYPSPLPTTSGPI
jgi:hypothetical protein